VDSWSRLARRSSSETAVFQQLFYETKSERAKLLALPIHCRSTDRIGFAVHLPSAGHYKSKRVCECYLDDLELIMKC
jgi:hypothetical protein